MREIHIILVTEYFAKKQAIDDSVKYFQENPDKYFVIVRIYWNDELNQVSGSDSMVVRREVISQFYGVDFVKSKERDLSKLAPVNKEEYLELYSALKFHSPEDEDVKKSLEISDKLFAIKNNIRTFAK